MKSFLFTISIFFAGLSLAQVGIGTTMPNASAALEVSSTNKGFLAPRVQLTGTSDVSTIAAPATGLMVYNLAAAGSGATAVYSGFYFFDGVKWQRIINQQPDATVEFNTASPNSGSPTFSPNTPASTDFIYVSTVNGSQWTWNGTTYVSFTPASTTPWYLGGGTSDAGGNKISTIYRTGAAGFGATSTIDNSAQVDVNSTSKGFLPPRMTKVQRDAIVNPASGLLVFCTNCSTSNGGCLVQNIGTPAAPNWECVGASSSSSSSSVTATCNGFVTGTYITGIPVNGTYTVTITNNSLFSVQLIFSSTNLVLSGVSGLTVTMPTPSATIIGGGTLTLSYTITGTPIGSGTLTGTWTKSSLSCSKTRNISLGEATFPNSVTSYVFSANDVSLTPNTVYQGTLPIGTTVQMPYTSGVGAYAAYASPFVSIPSQYCEDGASDWTFGYSYSAGTFSSSGNITVTLITKKAGVITAWNAKRVASLSTINFNCVTVPWLVNGNSYTKTVGIDEGGDAIRGALAQTSCASCAAYDAAAVNNWVSVTAAEYNTLKLLSNAYIGGLDDATMSATPTGLNWGGGDYTWFLAPNGTTVNSIPASHYVYAFSALGTGPFTAVKLGLATGSGTTSVLAQCGGNLLPLNNGGTGNFRYYALKRPTTATSAVSNLGGYNSSLAGGMGFAYIYGYGDMHVNTTGANTTFSLTSSVSGGSPFQSMVQCLSTSIKQW
jgi:hypothetical protein